MPTVVDPNILTNYYGTLFGIAAVPMTTLGNLVLGLTDAAGVSLTGAGVATTAPIPSSNNNWELFSEDSDCAGATGTGVSKSGIRNVEPVNFGPATSEWVAEYISFYSADGGNELFRVPLASTLTVPSGEGVTFPAGSIKLSSEYLT